MTSAELSAATGSNERYAREWLEQQAVTGLLQVEDETYAPPDRRYRLAPGVAQVLATPGELTFLAPLARQLVAAAAQASTVADAARDGVGVPWSAYGQDMMESQSDMNRAGFLHQLADDWLSFLPDVRDRLRAAPPARVADVGCGGGWAAIALARAYPSARVDAFDVDPATVEMARANVVDAGLTERVTVRCEDNGTVDADGGYDLVTAFECLHDMPYPVQALTAMRALAGDRGTVLVGDMKVADAFTAPGDDVERLMYGFSVLVCLPDGLSSPGSAATGAVIRQSTVRRYAAEAGFSSVETLPVEHEMWRFYRCRA